MAILARIRHWLGWNYGSVTSEIRGDEIWIGFACECGEVHHWHKARSVK